MQKLSPRAQRFTDELRERVFSEHHVINGLLCELALYFLIYTVRQVAGYRAGQGMVHVVQG